MTRADFAGRHVTALVFIVLIMAWGYAAGRQ
jgi:hypothetical protein